MTPQKYVYSNSHLWILPIRIQNFLAGHISLIILGDFDQSDLHITSANRLCLEGLDTQAAIWIRDSAILNLVKPYLEAQLA
ncbi:MAG: hypothetical protein AAFR87_20775 [Bacteroidota bacterium]